MVSQSSSASATAWGVFVVQVSDIETTTAAALTTTATATAIHIFVVLLLFFLCHSVLSNIYAEDRGEMRHHTADSQAWCDFMIMWESKRCTY